MTGRRRRVRRTAGRVGLAAFAALLTACSVSGAEPAPSGAVPGVAPLTGLAVSVSSSRPVLAVKIDNHPGARPQAGLREADVVFEEVVEGGLTRFVALFQSTSPGLVGPVRSVRPMDPEILAPWHGLLAYSGGIPAFVDLLRRSPVKDAGQAALPGAYHRVGGRSAPHNLFADPEALWARAGSGRSNPPAIFRFRAAGTPAPGEPAATLSLPFSRDVRVTYRYDPATNRWPRSQGGAPHTDAAGQPVAPDNLVVQFVATRQTGMVDTNGSPVVESVVTGEGEAWILSGGRLVKARWERRNASEPTVYTDEQGAVVELTPGRTWVELVPPGVNVRVE